MINEKEVVKVVSDEQKIKMLKKLSAMLAAMKGCQSIQEISNCTAIPTSTIQRYLNKKDLLLELVSYNQDLCDEIFEQNQLWLKRANTLGKQKGGSTTQARYGFEKKEFGKFNGSRKR